MAARTRPTAPYPSPSPKLFDENLPRLEDMHLRDAYDSQFRINQRLRRWGIEIADIINALELGDWDPSTRVVWIGDGADADYENITEALMDISPSFHDPRLLVVFPGTYFGRLYLPSHTWIYGLGPRESTKIRYGANDNEVMIEGGSQNIRLCNLDIRQTTASATGTKVIQLSATDITIDNVYVENAATASDSDVVILNNSSLTTGKNVLLNNVHIKGNNSAVENLEDERIVDTTTWTFIWPLDDFDGTYCYEIRYPANDDHFQMTGGATRWENLAGASPFGDACLHSKHAGTAWTDWAQQVNADLYTAGNVNAAAGVSGAIWYKTSVLSSDSGMTCIWDFGTETGANFETWALIVDHSDWHLYLINGRRSGQDWASEYLRLDLGNFRAKYMAAWHHYAFTYDKECVHFWIDGELRASKVFEKDYVWSGGGNPIRVGINQASATNLGDGHWSDALAYAGLLQPGQMFGGLEHMTLGISKVDENTNHSLVRLNNVVVENDYPNKNIVIGDVPFQFSGVSSVLASDNNDSANIELRNKGTSPIHIFAGVHAMFGEYSLVFNNINARITGKGGFFGNRPSLVPYTRRPYFEEDWTDRLSEGPIAAHELFLGGYLDNVNALYHGEFDGTGFLYPGDEGTTKSFENLDADNITARTVTAREFFDEFANEYFGVMDLPEWYEREILHGIQRVEGRDFVRRIGGNAFRRFRDFKRTVEEVASGSEPSWDLMDVTGADIKNNQGGWALFSTRAPFTDAVDPAGEWNFGAGGVGDNEAYVQRYHDDGLMTGITQFSVKATFKLDAADEYAVWTDGSFALDFFTGAKRVRIHFYDGSVYLLGESGWVEFGTDVDTDVGGDYHDWYMTFDLTTGAGKLYKDTELVATTADCFDTNTSTSGRIYAVGIDYSGVAPHVDGHLQTLKIASVAQAPPGTVEQDVNREDSVIDYNVEYEDIQNDGLIMPEPPVKNFENVYADDLVAKELQFKEELYGDGAVRVHDNDEFPFPHHGGTFIRRPDPGEFDFEVGDMTTDGSVVTMDLSAIIPREATYVFFRCRLKDDAVGSGIAFTYPGNAGWYNATGVYTQVANVFMECLVGCPVKDQKIKYVTSAVTFTNIDICVTGWFE